MGRLRLGRGEQAGNFTQFCAGIGDGFGGFIQRQFGGRLAGVSDQKRQPGLRIVQKHRLGGMVAMILFEDLTGANQRIALIADQMLDLQSQLNVITAVKPLAGSTFIGLELVELRLPKAQDIGLNATDARHIANLEVEAVGDDRRVKVAILG